jgi:hypothetical protein
MIWRGYGNVGMVGTWWGFRHTLGNGSVWRKDCAKGASVVRGVIALHTGGRVSHIKDSPCSNAR